jgi:histidinol-phosphate/aromatic aminotransferase/cobyric acid decarboxylase-like protein
MQIYTKYEKDYHRACEQFIAEREDFERKLHTIPFLRVMPSQANYFLCEVLPPFTARELVVKMLQQHNILLRDCSEKQGLDGKQYMRISVRSHEDNAQLISAMTHPQPLP